MNAGYNVRRMGNKNLEIRIAGSSSRPQVHGRFLSCLSDLVTIKCKLLDRRQKGQRKEGKMGEELLFPSLFPLVSPVPISLPRMPQSGC